MIKRYKSNDGRLIFALIRDDKVEWGIEEEYRILDETMTKTAEFQAMIKREGWIEEDLYH